MNSMPFVITVYAILDNKTKQLVQGKTRKSYYFHSRSAATRSADFQYKHDDTAYTIIEKQYEAMDRSWCNT